MPETKPRRRPVPTWAIHSTEGIRIAGGTAPDWWAASRPDDPESGPAIADCTDAPERGR